ncbi:fatty acyl-AMP ligase [Mycobacterium sp. 852002-51057_SCH5723018]|uniref:fatty acyl-AMP ligase n=1 Tax=Mycobacterium sp. 852002-51057_SCH5723018 TaxID=1834094 RepID=UPI0007FFF363|nr:fatty acyl-AMP ligase [Mycobacterium sp. 852002-51057_SCH5723018]OBG28528.1 AMP-dependent synthetase [Mycobacterium sp. 852002-51057_SCH5723018]
MKGAPAIEPRHETLTEMLATAAQSGESLFFVDRKEQDLKVPMAQVREHALSIAADLTARGVQKGDRVALVLPTGPEFVESLFGVLCAGAIPVPLYPPVRLGRLEEYHHKTAAMLQAVDAALVVTDERIRRFLGVAVSMSAPRLGCVTASSLGGWNSLEVEVAPDDVALIQFSSGTTNDPKPVALTHASLLSNLASIEAYLIAEGEPNPVGVTWLPLYHDMGLIGNLLSAFYVPAPLVLLPPELFVAVPGAWLRAISRHRGTVTAAPNFAFGLCLNRIRDDELDGVDLSSWRVSLNGAEAVSAAVQRRFDERFARWGLSVSSLTPCYGMAEASLAITFKPAGTSYRTLGLDAEKLAAEGIVEPGSKQLVSVGRPLAGVEVEIRDPDGRSLPPGRVGHIFVRGPSVMVGYFGRTDLTDQALHDGWLDSGDLGFTYDGELFVCGRHKDIVIVRGANHAPEEFEAALDGLPGVRTGCAVAVGFVPAGEDDEALAMLVETTSEASATLAEDVASRIQERTRIRPAHVELLAPGTLPRTSSGKLRRHEARTQWLAGTLAPPKKVTAARLLVKAAHGELRHARASFARHTAAKKPSVTTKP